MLLYPATTSTKRNPAECNFNLINHRTHLLMEQNREDCVLSTRLFNAIKTGDFDTITDLVRVDPQIFLMRSHTQATPLMWATLYGYRRIAEFILQNKNDPGAQDRKGDTALHWVAQTGNQTIASLLIAYHAPLTARNEDGKMPLHIAVEHDHAEVALLLIRAGTPVNEPDGGGQTPLFGAVIGNNADLVFALCESGAGEFLPGTHPPSLQALQQIAQNRNHPEVARIIAMYNQRITLNRMILEVQESGPETSFHPPSLTL